jgi:aminoglycoside 6'-N-acetyltransferase
MASTPYQFCPLSADDLPLIQRWLAQPHVAQWWPATDVQLGHIRDHIDDPAIDPFLVRIHDRPIGYLQCYDPHGEDEHPFHDQPEGTRGIDQFIGEPDLIGRGHGSALTRAFVDQLFAAGAPMVVTDPDPANGRAVRAYEKAGFIANRLVETPWGRTLLMVCTA